MAITVVQAQVISSSGWSGSFTNPVAAGNTVILVATGFANNASISGASPQFAGSNALALALPPVQSTLTDPSGQPFTGATVWTAGWVLPKVAGGSASVGVSVTGSSTSAGAVGLFAMEVSGLGMPTVLAAAPGGSAGHGTALDSGSASAGSGNALVVAAGVAFGQAVSAVGGSFTSLRMPLNYSELSYAVTTSGGSYDWQATAAASAAWVAALWVIVPGNASWPDLAFGLPSTSGGVTSYPVATYINGAGPAPQTVRVLPPTSPAAGWPHGFLITLPAADGEDDTSSGDGFDIAQGLGAHNSYNLTIVESSYTTPGGLGPCHANNPNSSSTQQEAYDLELIRWARATFGSPSNRVYIIGYSKSALGAMGLIFRNPGLIYKAAGWDLPADIANIEGDSQSQGAGYYASLASIMSGGYGTDLNFQGNYELTPAHLASWLAADTTFGILRRIWIGGYANFQQGVTWLAGQLATAGILADTSWSSAETHAWHSDWVAAALLSMLGSAPPVTGSGGITLGRLSIAVTGTVLPPPPPAQPALIWRPCYCNRSEVMRALDFAPGVDANAATDRAMLSGAENIDGQLHRVFYPSDDTRYFDWPPQGGTGGGQYAEPWRLWMDDNDLVAMASLTTGGVTIPLSAIFPQPWSNPVKFRPYYNRIELDRGQPYFFGGQAPTPQSNIAIAATWGYGADADLCGYLASAVHSGDATITLTTGTPAGPGDLLVLGYGRGATTASAPYMGAIAPFLGERVLVTDVSTVSTGLTQSGSGATTESTEDNALATTGSGSLSAGEVIVLDQEQMLVEQVVAGVATVRRAFAGTALQTHSGATVYAYRQYSVVRAMLGTTAGAYSSGAAVMRHRVPQLVRDLAIAESEVQLLNEGSAYARTVGSGESAAPAPGIGLMDKWAEVRARHGRKARYRGV